MKSIKFSGVTVRTLVCFAMALLAGVSVSGQTTAKLPLFQTITITNGKDQPHPTPTPGVKRTSSSSPINAPAVSNGLTRSIPALAGLEIPGNSGILVESMDGDIVIDSFSETAFNPASNVKVATVYAVLRTFGVNYRFRTDIWTDGQIEPVTGTLTGNLYISGRDPMFNLEHGVSIANELNRLGVNRINGDLIVTENFAMGYSASSKRSGNLLQTTLDGSARSQAASTAWVKYIVNSGRYSESNSVPGVVVSGSSYVESLPTNARLLFSHESTPLREIVKVTMSYSNNFLSERLGDMLGGAYGVTRIVQRDAGVLPGHFSLQTCSGLGINRVTPHAQMKLLRAFNNFLKQNKMEFQDVMPVAGMDDGTLRRRYGDMANLGSVVGKTGTLSRTDGGVSSLSGQVSTVRGKYLFVIFNQNGSVHGFRRFQDDFVPMLQDIFGGAGRLDYVPVTMERRLAKTRISYPRG